MRDQTSRFLFLTALLGVNGCSLYSEPYLTVQACIEDDSAFVGAFPSLIAGVVEKHGLSVVDRSAASDGKKEPIDQTIAIELEKRGVIKVMVSNLGLPDDQVVLGFFGDNETDRDVSHDVLEVLKQRWLVASVPAGQGAVAINCEGEAPSAAP